MTAIIEQETIINFNEGEDEASIYTASPIVRRKCERLGYVLVKTDKLQKTGEQCSWWFTCKKNQISLRKRIPATNIMSPEARESARQRMRTLRSNQLNGRKTLESQI